LKVDIVKPIGDKLMSKFEHSMWEDIRGVIAGRALRSVYYPDYEVLKRVVDALKALGYKIVMTMGTFDMFHDGHAEYLLRARELGDLLVVGVDTDELTQKRKGPRRPFAKLDERLKVLSTQKSVDIMSLVRIGEDPDELIKIVRPNILVVSSSTKDVDEEKISRFREICGDVVVFPPQSSNSTTSRMRELMVDGALENLEGLHVQLGATIDALKKSKEDNHGY